MSCSTSRIPLLFYLEKIVSFFIYVNSLMLTIETVFLEILWDIFKDVPFYNFYNKMNITGSRYNYRFTVVNKWNSISLSFTNFYPSLSPTIPLHSPTSIPSSSTNFYPSLTDKPLSFPINFYSFLIHQLLSLSVHLLLSLPHPTTSIPPYHLLYPSFIHLPLSLPHPTTSILPYHQL